MPEHYRLAVTEVNRFPAYRHSCDYSTSDRISDNNSGMRKPQNKKQIDRSPLAERLEKEREAAGLSRAEAAEKLHMAYSTIASHENGQTPNVKIDDLKKYAKLYKTSVTLLLDGGQGAKLAPSGSADVVEDDYDSTFEKH